MIEINNSVEIEALRIQLNKKYRKRYRYRNPGIEKAQYRFTMNTEKRTVPVPVPKLRYRKKNRIGSKVKGTHP